MRFNPGKKLNRKVGLSGLLIAAAFAVLLVYTIRHSGQAAIIGDVNGDGTVNVTDLSLVLSNWSKATVGDINNDGTVNVFDLSIVLSNWGRVATPTPTPTLAPTPTLTPTPTPTPTPSPTASSMLPVGVPGPWILKFNDEFNGTALDRTKWDPNWFGEGGVMNKVGTYSSNVSVAGGNLLLKLASSSSGALVHTGYSSGRYTLPVGGYTEARIFFPGSGETCNNWPAWWASGPNWPAAGEHDIAEVLSGKMTVNYHSSSGAHNQGTVPGSWCGSYHTYGLWRKSGSAEVYYDGVKVKSYSTDDNRANEELILNVGAGSNSLYGTASQVKVDYVRAWHQ